MNKKRQAIWDKSGGKCWYCGCELPEKGWHADHYYPIVRDLEVVKDDRGVSKMVTGKGCAYPELDTIDNLVPSCAPCNNFKHSYHPDWYRKEISNQFENTLKYSTGLRQLHRMNLIDIEPKPVVFWFETQGIVMPTEFELVGISEEAANIEWHIDNSEPNYFYHNFGKFICSLRRIDNYWLAIAKGFDWSEWGRKRFTSDRNVKAQVAEWALRLEEPEHE